jgi:hypothetical protein
MKRPTLQQTPKLSILQCYACLFFFSYIQPIQSWQMMASAKRKVRNKQRAKQRQQSGTSVGRATDLAPSVFAGVTEDHAYEQFFYSDATNRRLSKIVHSYRYPVLLCNPSLAVIAEEADMPYRLLDRDRRFSFLKGFREFSLAEPYLVDESYDAIFCDPPFANVTPQQLVKCLRLMAPSRKQASVPLYIAYNSIRENALLEAFKEYPGPQLERKFGLTYRSVREDTQKCIYLYGPKGPFPS